MKKAFKYKLGHCHELLRNLSRNLQSGLRCQKDPISKEYHSSTSAPGPLTTYSSMSRFFGTRILLKMFLKLMNALPTAAQGARLVTNVKFNRRACQQLPAQVAHRSRSLRWDGTKPFSDHGERKFYQLIRGALLNLASHLPLTRRQTLMLL